jgi:hypothetical protein
MSQCVHVTFTNVFHMAFCKFNVGVAGWVAFIPVLKTLWIMFQIDFTVATPTTHEAIPNALIKSVAP